jgi:hypothetical protein
MHGSSQFILPQNCSFAFLYKFQYQLVQVYKSLTEMLIVTLGIMNIFTMLSFQGTSLYLLTCFFFLFVFGFYFLLYHHLKILSIQILYMFH